jgi:hypothetical protein
MANFASTARIKRVLGIPSGVTMHDTYIGELASSTDGEVLGYCGLVALTRTVVTDTFDIDSVGQNEVMLRNFPVAGLSSVVSAGETLAATQYYLDERTGAVRLKAAGASFTEGRQQVEITYTCGYADGSPEMNTIAHASATLAAARFNASRHAGMRSEGQGGYRYILDSSGIPAPVRAMLSQFIRIMPRGDTP